MKNCFLLLFLLPLFSLAQDCKLKKSVDPFTHETKLSTGFQNFTNNGLTVSISADATAKEIDFFIWIKGDNKCFDAESVANVTFEGERSKTILRNAGSMNCDGAFHFVFKNSASTPTWLTRMATKKLATIKLVGTDKKEMVIAFSDEQKVLFQSMAACMTTEGKTLLVQ
ncbi:hypothetical protein [Flavisolibacter nicotianae]|uniref:hypothetical protein n=1 Tax=Flavisolibacter nicotianae TaxID=2364882 RepID=UPI000EB5C0A0|nr:hypothetical protein [Flavisolibacter nicotianae]